jgi:hypothetical protein
MRKSQIILIAVMFLATTSNQSHGFDKGMVCHEARKPGFEEVMTYMAGGGETCKNHFCNADKAILGDNVYVEVWQNPDSELSLVPRIKKHVDTATNVIAEIVNISFSSKFQGADSFLFILVLSPGDIERIASGAVSDIDQRKFQNYILPAIKKRKCAGIATHIIENGIGLIPRSLIFIPDSLESDKEIGSCVLEEIMNSTGLYRDPPGQASLFDNDNYRDFEGSILYSEATLSMLYLHYMITRGSYRDVGDFLRRNCTLDTNSLH